MINDIRPAIARFFRGGVALCALALFLFGCPAETPAPNTTPGGMPDGMPDDMPDGMSDTTAPAAVTLTATLGSVHGSVALSWDEPADTDFSHVLLSWTPTGGDQTQPLRVNKGTKSRTVTGLPPGEYSFSAVSVDGSDNQSSASAAAEATVPPAPTAAASGAAATMIIAGVSTLTWSDPSPTTGIAALEITGMPGPTTAVEVALGVETHTLTGLSLTAAHTFTITSVDSSGVAVTAGAAEVSASQALDVAMFALGAQDGDFGFGACEKFRKEDSGTVAAALRSAGYTKAVFFGSTPDYSFIDIATDPDALGVTGPTNDQLKARNVVAYASATPITTFGEDMSKTTRTIGSVLDVEVGTPATSTGVWNDNGYDVVGSVTSADFWSFTTDDTGGYSTSNCSGASVNTGSLSAAGTGVPGNDEAIDGNDSTTTLLSSCATSTYEVLCVAH